MQNCNLWCLPENYNFKYYLYHYASWGPQLYVAEENNQVCGYVLSKMDDESDEQPEVANPSNAATRPYHFVVDSPKPPKARPRQQTYELFARVHAKDPGLRICIAARQSFQ